MRAPKAYRDVEAAITPEIAIERDRVRKIQEDLSIPDDVADVEIAKYNAKAGALSLSLRAQYREAWGIK